MKIAFRADASPRMASGHFMRCFALAGELKKSGVKIRFISQNLPLHLRKMLDQQGFECESISISDTTEEINNLDHSSRLEISQAEDARMTIRALADEESWDWIVVDHYSLDKKWEEMVRVCAKKILVIDDLADREHYCDVLLDQNYNPNLEFRYMSKVPKNCQLLLGPQYALLRDEFRVFHINARPHAGKVGRVLVFFGGVDIDNFTSLAIQALASIKKNLIVDVVLGQQHPHKKDIKKSCIKYGFNLHIQTENMANLMRMADIAIGAGGSASWERCCLGLPAVLVAIAQNQVEIARSLDAIGGCLYLGEKNGVNLLNIKNAISGLLENPNQLMSISNIAFNLVDGMGTSRVVKKLGL